MRYSYRGFPVGARIETLPSVSPKRYANRCGVVSQHHDGEFGVRFGSSDAVWFHAHELRLIEVAS